MSTKNKQEFTWICPKCRELYYGWSNLRICSICGYEEKNNLRLKQKDKHISQPIIEHHPKRP